MNQIQLVKKAEADIAEILKALEVATATIVDHIEVRDIEVTTMDDDRVKLQRRVVIDLKRPPGTNWT